MVTRVREKLVTEGLDAVLSRKKRVTPPIKPIFDGEAQAQLTALACSDAARGPRALVASGCWPTRSSSARSSRPRTSTLSAARLKKRAQAAPEALLGDPAQSQRRLRRRDGGRARGLPPTARSRRGRSSASTRPRKQLVAETRQPLPMRPGQPARYDYEYKRNGTANLFMLFAPLEGWRHVKVTERRTAIDFAHVLRDLSDIHFARAAEDRAGAGQPQHARALRRSTRRSSPPRRAASSSASSGTTRPSTAAGSIWPSPNSPSSPANASTGASRTPRRSTREVDAWLARRNACHAKANWRFTTEDARIKLKSLYPSL